jgi:prepilin-type N-terminal cleavage/methylation domain-containing protein
MTHAQPPAGRPEAGFSFVEILIVMGIIAVLAGMTTLIFGIWSREGPEFTTRQRMTTLVSLAHAWKTKFDRLPPSDPRKIQGIAGGVQGIAKLPNDVNLGIESLFQALHWPSFGQNPLPDGDLGNTDQDSLDKAATAHGAALKEVVDAWGSPFVYFLHTDYPKAWESPPTYVNGRGEDVYPKPWKYEDESRGFVEPLGFQLFSMGPDRQPNTEDDLRHWDR